MLDPKDIEPIANWTISNAKADRVEAIFWGFDNSLTRFTKNSIHQNVSENNEGLSVKVGFGTKVGVASTNQLNKESIQDAIERARAIAKVRPEDPDLPPLQDPQSLPSIQGYSLHTASMPPAERASQVHTVLRLVEDLGFQASGSFSTGTSQLALATSKGHFAHYRRTLARFLTVVTTDSSSGYAEHLAIDAKDIDHRAVAREAIEKASLGQNPTSLEPGEYEVVLEPYAVSDILDFLGFLGFGALAVQEGRSFMSGKLAQSVMGGNVSIWDDGQDPIGIPSPFDYEGRARQRVDLIRNGIAISPCYDTITARKDGKTSTGHAPPPGFETMGPVPMNMFLKPGNASREEIIGSVKRGVLVTRFWYTRVVHPLLAIITGMTRDGTFLIENGKIARPIKNLRFTQSYVEALNNVEMIGRDALNMQTLYSFNRVPMLKTSKWNFTGATEY